MPSQLHEALLLLFRNRPTLAPELMRDALRCELPAFTEARIDSADLTDVKPAEYRADLVVLLLDGLRSPLSWAPAAFSSRSCSARRVSRRSSTRRRRERTRTRGALGDGARKR